MHARSARIALFLSALVALAATFGALCQDSYGAPPEISTPPEWRIEAQSDSTVAPGGELVLFGEVQNLGEPTNGEPVTLKVLLPAGLRAVSIGTAVFPPEGSMSCPVLGPQVIECSGESLVGFQASEQFRVTLEAGPEASGILVPVLSVAGGGAPAGTETVSPVHITPDKAGFGLRAFDFAFTNSSGAPEMRAASHPNAQTTNLAFDTETTASAVLGPNAPVADAKEVIVEAPAGLLGDLSAYSQCPASALELENSPYNYCPPSSQVGVVRVRNSRGSFTVLSLFNMVPPSGIPARFAFNVEGTIVVLDAHVRSEGDYGVNVVTPGIPQGLAITGSDVTFWGVPSGDSHTPERACAGFKPTSNASTGAGPSCAAGIGPSAFLRDPSRCSVSGAGLGSTARMDSWQRPGAFVAATTVTHAPPGFPYPSGPATFPAGYTGPTSWGEPVGIEGCASVPFEPSLSTSLTSHAGDSPTGLTVDIGLPSGCWDPKSTEAEAESAICQSDMKEARVALPKGLSINPSAANGRVACTPAQVGLTTPVDSQPIHFSEAPAACPDASKIGTVEIDTPLLGKHQMEAKTVTGAQGTTKVVQVGEPVLDSQGVPVPEPLTGSVYLAQQGNNPFNSLLSMYLVAEGSGVVVKQAGEVSIGPDGQLTTTFHETPQTPFSSIHVELFGGPRAALKTPAACGTYTTTATLTPWSGNGAVTRQSTFQVSEGCGGGFDPKLDAGSQNPLAGQTTPFVLRLTRNDGSQEIAGLTATLPPGLSGYLKGIPYCSDATLASVSGNLGTGRAQEASPACPPASQVGTVTVGAGAGPTPFYTSQGRAYLAGPYKGAPLSLAVVAPAVAGPFDLGTVVVRNALRIDPESAVITAQSDPIPTILHGIPLDLRDIRVQLDRPHFTLNPTSCEPMSVGSTVTSAQGTTASPSVHFQAAGCERLGFKPRLSLKLKGGVRRSANPALTAVLRARPGDANIGRIQVALPHSEFLAQSHIKTICTRVQFAANQCPAGSIYGRVTAISPIVDYPLTGNVYLRSSDNPLPDMVLALRGPASQPIAIDAVGRIDSKKGGIRTTFATVPDQPLTRVVLQLPAGKKSLLENSTNICRGKHRATVSMDAHNGRLLEFRAPLQAKCPKQKHKRHA